VRTVILGSTTYIAVRRPKVEVKSVPKYLFYSNDCSRPKRKFKKIGSKRTRRARGSGDDEPRTENGARLSRDGNARRRRRRGRKKTGAAWKLETRARSRTANAVRSGSHGRRRRVRAAMLRRVRGAAAGARCDRTEPAAAAAAGIGSSCCRRPHRLQRRRRGGGCDGAP